MSDTRPPYAGRSSAAALASRPLLVVGALTLLLIVAVVGGIIYAGGQAKQPGILLSHYCSDMSHQNYTNAYTLLSSGAQARTSATQWIQDAQLHDQIDGKVTSCTASQVSSGPLTFASAGASATLTIARTKTASGLVALSHEVGGWKVDKLDVKLQGADLGPLLVSEQFCDALAKQDFTSAYADLSKREQAGASQSDFTKDFTQALSGAAAKVTGCAPQIKSYAVQATSATVDVQMQLQVALTSGSTTATVPLTFSLVTESSGWKIDDIKATGS